MARSLTVQHEENVHTNSLLNGFLLLAFGWMLLNAMSWSSAEADTPRSDADGYAPSADIAVP